MISSEKWDIKLKWNKHIPGMPQGMKIFPRFYYKKILLFVKSQVYFDQN